MIVREAGERDLPEISALEKLCFSDPWSEESLKMQISSPLSLMLVCESEKRVLGYAYGSVIAPEGELYRIAVASDARKRGVGTLLLNSFFHEMRKRGAATVYLEVRETNLAARTLYEKAGFSLVGIRKNYYHEPLENAAVMRKEGL